MDDMDVLIKLNHADKAEFDKAIHAWRSQAFLATLVPDPRSFNDHNKGCICTLCHKARTEWRQENWMTPHDLVDIFAEYASARIVDGVFVAKAVMAGRPPLAALDYLYRCKNYDVTCLYYGPKHFGWGVYRNGAVEHHTMSNYDTSVPVSEELQDFAASCHGDPGPSIERAAREHFGRNVTPKETLDFMYGPFYKPSRGSDIQDIDFYE